MTQDPDRPLPRGLQRHRRQFRARLPGQPWVYFGTDYHDAVRAFSIWRTTGGRQDTVKGLLEHFTTIACPANVKSGKIAERTAKDYRTDAGILIAALGHIPIAALEAKHIFKFRDARAADAPSHIRNEMACLSAALSFGVERGWIKTNVALQVPRPGRKRRERLISDAEYLAVYQRAHPSVRLAMTLALRTLALPDDILAMGPRNVIKSGDRRILRFPRGKTGVWVEIEIVGELAQIIDAHSAAKIVRLTFVHREDGKAYTTEGLGAMFRRAAVGNALKPLKASEQVRDFGLRDLRAKGATEMYRAGTPLRTLQYLLGHKSSKTTEIYIKELVPEVVRPNERALVAEVSR